MQPKAGCKANARVVPAWMNIDPNCVASSGDGIVTEGPAQVRSVDHVQRHAVQRQVVDARRDDEVECRAEGESAGALRPLSGASLMGFGENMPPE